MLHTERGCNEIGTALSYGWTVISLLQPMIGSNKPDNEGMLSDVLSHNSLVVFWGTHKVVP